MVLWGDKVQAQLQELQQAFTQPGGQTLTIPVQATGTTPSGSPLGFLPVVHTNQTASGLRIASIVSPAWNTCFPLGVPSPLPVTPARPDAQCAIGTTLAPGNACWVDVAQLCADAAAAVQGSHPSQLQADSNSVAAGSQVSGNVLTNDSDADGPLTVASFRFQGVTYPPGATASVPGVGSFSLQSNGAYSFTAVSPFTGVSPAAWTYVVQTGVSSTLSVTVSPLVANSPPVANDDTASTLRNSSVIVAVRTNDTDADGNVLSVTGVTQGTNGSVVIDTVTNDPIYTPNAGFAGTDVFTYTISDGNGGNATGNVTVTVIGNRPPVAVANSVTTSVDTASVIPAAILLANDTDPDGDTLSIVSVQAATQGTVSLAGGNVTFTPAAGYEGSASYTYTIQDPEGESSTATVSVVVGYAQMPSVVVQKALVVNAHGTGGASARFPIITALVDTDGSESLTIRVSSVPSGASFNAGVNLGGGVWQFTEAELSNLMISLPGGFTTNATNLTVQVISTEVNGGATASVASAVTLKASYTTSDITTTESGNFTASSANEYIQGGSGNNVINASTGNNIVRAGAGDDSLAAGSGSDMLYGEDGDDTFNGGSGADVLVGGPGNDTMQGGDAGENFVDVFVWNLGDQGASGTPAIDTILNFSAVAAGSNTSGGDVLNLSDLLQGERVGPSNGAGNLADYLHIVISGGDTLIHISHTGGFAGDSHTVGAAYNSAAETQRIVLVGVDLQSVYSGATTDAQIITQLLNNNKLIVD